MKESSGTLLYRHGPGGLEVLLVHPSGNYNRKAPWGIPKGELDDGGDLEANARLCMASAVTGFMSSSAR